MLLNLKLNRLLKFALYTILVCSSNIAIAQSQQGLSSGQLNQIELSIETMEQGEDWIGLTSALVKKAKRLRQNNSDSSSIFYTLQKAEEAAFKVSDPTQVFLSIYKVRESYFKTDVRYQQRFYLDDTLQSLLPNPLIHDSLRTKVHKLWGNIYLKHNYHLQALNEYLTALKSAKAQQNENQVVNVLTSLLVIYDVLGDEALFNKTRNEIEELLPQVNRKTKTGYYLRLRGFERRYSREETESYLFKAIAFARGSSSFAFQIKKQLAIYYISHEKEDSAIALIKTLEQEFIEKNPYTHLHAKIHIEELYARYYYSNQDFAKAEVHYSRALQLCDTYNSPYLKRNLLLLALDITANIDDYQLAFEALRDLQLLEDSTMNRSQVIEYQKLKNQLAQEQVSRQITTLEFKRRIAELKLENKNKNLLWLLSITITLLVFLLFIVHRYQVKRKLSRELQDLNNLKDFIFSVITHDLRSPLYNFNTLLSMAENKYVKEEEYSDYLKTIRNELVGITSITESLLRWAKSNQGYLKVNLSEFSLLDVVAEVRDLFQPDLVERKIHVISSFIYDFTIRTDKDLFSFILRNLIQNAMKFSEDNSEIEIHANKERETVTIEVKDHGVGMTTEQIKNYNASLSSSTKDLKGTKSTGIGLIIAKDFAKRLNIKTTVASEKGRGTTVKLTFSSPRS